jgi:hypothetical protein
MTITKYLEIKLSKVFRMYNALALIERKNVLITLSGFQTLTGLLKLLG